MLVYRGNPVEIELFSSNNFYVFREICIVTCQVSENDLYIPTNLESCNKFNHAPTQLGCVRFNQDKLSLVYDQKTTLLPGIQKERLYQLWNGELILCQ